MIEEWKPIIKYEDYYEVSNFGRIRSKDRLQKHPVKNTTFIRKGKLLKPIKNDAGYNLVTLSFQGKQKSYYFHRIVAQHFITNNENKPDVNHLDGNKENNRADNLEWSTEAENNLHAVRIGLHNYTGSYNGNAKLKEEQVLKIRQMLKNKIQQKKICEEFGVSQFCIYTIKNNLNWKHI